MNNAQTRLLRWLDSEWTKHRRAAGLAADRDARLAFYSKACGRVVTSSKLLRNDDVTAIKRAVLALTQPANFSAQMQSQVDNDPVAVADSYRERIYAALDVLKPDHDFRVPAAAPQARNNYYTAVAAKMFGVPVHELTNPQLRQLVGLFEARAKARQKREQAAARRYAEAAGEASDRDHGGAADEWSVAEGVEF